MLELESNQVAKSPQNIGGQGGLSAINLLSLVYDGLKSKSIRPEIVLPPGIGSEVGDDSDWHRTRRGYMIYNSAVILKSGLTTWAVAKSTETQGYPADRYSADLSAFKLEVKGKTRKWISQQLNKLIEESSYFQDSLVSGFYDGRLGINPENNFGKKIAEFLGPDPDKYITKAEEVDNQFVYLDLRPVMKSPRKYKHELVSVLSQAIIEVLS